MAAAPAVLPGAVAGSGPESAERSSANSNGPAPDAPEPAVGQAVSNGPAPDAPEPAVGQAVSKGRSALGAASWPGPDGRASPEGRQLRRFKAAGSFVRYAVRAESEAAKKRRKESVCINPDGRLRNTWDAMMSFVLIVIGTVLPFRIGFQVEIEVTSVIGVASVLTDVLFIVDIVLNFNTGYTRSDGQFEMNRKKARLYYLKHWFFIDLLASLPIRYIGWLMKAQADSDESFTKVVKVLRLLRLTHLLRLAKFRKQWEQHKEEFAGLQTAGKLLACIFAMLYACHCIACAWFYFGTMGADGAVAAPGGWIEAEWPDHTHGPNGTFNGVDNVERYVTSLYWAITVVSTVGFGEIHPETTVEKAFSTFAELVGCFIFMVLVGNLSSIMLSESPIDKKVKQALGEAREFLLDKQVDGKLRARTLGALEHTFRARVHDEKHKIIGELPKAMQEVLQENLYAAFNDLALFRPFRGSQMSRGSREAVGELCALMRPLVVTPADDGEAAAVYQEGDSAGEIFFVVRGVVHITAGSGQSDDDLRRGQSRKDLMSVVEESEVLLELEEGDHFGERELFYRHSVETDQLTQQNVMAKMAASRTRTVMDKAPPTELPLHQRKRHQNASVTAGWAGNASLFFLRWEDCIAQRESPNLASRAIFQLLQTGAASRLREERTNAGRAPNSPDEWEPREDALHYPFAKKIQEFYRKHKSGKYNHALETGLAGLDPNLQVVMRAVMKRVDTLDTRVADLCSALEREREEAGGAIGERRLDPVWRG